VDATQGNETPDLAILLEAMAAVVGEVSKVYQAVKRAVDTGDATDYRRALGAFDGLPAWQKQRILRVATARAEEEVAVFDEPQAVGGEEPPHAAAGDAAPPTAD